MFDFHELLGRWRPGKGWGRLELTPGKGRGRFKPAPG
jgi:hypothetical protein